MAGSKKNDLLSEPENKKKFGCWQWAVFVFFIPLLFAIIVAVGAMTIAGENVLEKSKQVAAGIPYLSEWTDNGETKINGKTDKEKITDLEKQIAQKKAEEKKLQQNLDEAQKKNEELLVEQDRLKAQFKQLQQQKTEAEEKQENTKSDIVKTYEAMDEKSIAKIIINLTNNEATALLQQLKAEKQAAILEELEAEKAAEYTQILSLE